MSGPIRQQLGPTRKRLTDQVTEARAFCEEELTDEILERLLKDLKKLLGRITKKL